MQIESMNVVKMTLEERKALDNALKTLAQFTTIYTQGCEESYGGENIDPLNLTLEDISDILNCKNCCSILC